MNEGRIRPEILREAYEKTDMKAIRQTFYSNLKDNEYTCACGIGAVYAASGADDLWSLAARTYAEVIYGMDYTQGFIDGFDGDFDLEDLLEFGRPVTNARYKLGLRDGRDGWRALKEWGLTI